MTAKINTYFGDIETLAWYGYLVIPAGTTVPAITTAVDVYGSATDAEIATAIGHATATASSSYAKLLHAVPSTRSSTQASLFDWAKTDIAVKIGLGTNFRSTSASASRPTVGVRLNFGFTFTF